MLLDENDTCAYNFLISFFPFVGLFFLKNFEISLTSLGNLAGMKRSSLLMLMDFSIFFLSLLLVLTGLSLGVNFDRTFCLKELLFLSVIRESHPEL